MGTEAQTMSLGRTAGVVWLLAAALTAGAQTAPDPNPPGHVPAPQSAATGTEPGSPGAAPQQEGAQPGLLTLELSTRLVVLDVTVTDRKGNPVTHLTRDDFTVLEDKRPQQIRSFDPPDAHRMPAGVVVQSTADLRRIGDAPVTLIVIDELNSQITDMTYAREQTVRYLASQPAQLRQPTELLVATSTRFTLLHDYTQDRDALEADVKAHKPGIPYKLGRGAQAVERMAQSIAALEQIAQASAGTPGRKNVVWIGNGFPSVDTVPLDERTRDTIEEAVKHCVDMLLAARVTMYTINPTINTTATVELDTPDDLDGAQNENGASPFDAQIQFATLAPETGGRVFQSRNDIGAEIGEGIAQGDSYYTLSYAPTNTSDSRTAYRHIRIVMKDPNLHATTRDGYYPPPPPKEVTNVASTEAPKRAANQLKLDIASAVNSALPYNGLEVAAVRAGANWTLTVKSKGLDWRGAGATEQAEATVIAAWYDGKGRLVGHSGHELTATRAAGTDAPETEFHDPADALPAGVARLRFVVRDAASGKMGTVDLKP